ncbi:MAG: hypothetical protein NT069_20000 [Planctomycetota bacterium]|nr:hypothetical protein [Planctomycetota bacterium]
MGMVRGAIGGVIAGAIGAAIWAAIAHYANAEIGYVAWGIGFLVGLGVRMLGGDSHGKTMGAMAAGIAILAIVAGKYAAAGMALDKALQEHAPQVSENDMFHGMAHEVCQTRINAGEKLVFPPGKTLDNAENSVDYPPGIWDEAVRNWQSIDPATRQQLMQARQEQLQMLAKLFGAEMRMQVFKESFGPFDLLWCLLAVSTAFRLGSGGQEE